MCVLCIASIRYDLHLLSIVGLSMKTFTRFSSITAKRKELRRAKETTDKNKMKGKHWQRTRRINRVNTPIVDCSCSMKEELNRFIDLSNESGNRLVSTGNTLMQKYGLQPFGYHFNKFFHFFYFFWGYTYDGYCICVNPSLRWR